MRGVISVEPTNYLANPTSISWTGSHTIVSGTRYLIRATPGNSVSTMTVPQKFSQLIQNEGAYPFSVVTTGNSSVTIQPGGQLQVAWDDGQAKHELQLSGTNPTAIKAVSFHQYVVTTNDVQTGGAVILTPNTASAVMVFTGGIAVGPLDAFFTPSTSVLSWSGLGMAATVEPGEVLQIIAIGV